jgi:H+-transporting ATPase
MLEDIMEENKKMGLTNEEVHKRLQQFGENYIQEKPPNHLAIFLKKFWIPVAWMLEFTIFLQLILKKYDQAIVIAILLVFNAIISYFQEFHAEKVLTQLKRNLAITTRVLRDGKWQIISARYLVPGDCVHLRIGDIIPADIRLSEGNLLIDQSILTGESLPVASQAGKIVYSGATIKHGEATGEVVATAQRTYFGKSVELIKTAKPASQIPVIIFSIVRYLIVIDLVVVSCVFVFALITKMPFLQVLSFLLILLIASVPIALPATFTLATAIGAMRLAKRNVLVTHLTAIVEAASMDILCVDKTGTITKNKLKVERLKPFGHLTEDKFLYLAGLASNESTNDPIDNVILDEVKKRKILTSFPKPKQFLPFDPTNKRTEAVYDLQGSQTKIIKGAPSAILNLIQNQPNIEKDINYLAHLGYRLIAIAFAQENNELQFAGLIALSDELRNDAKARLNHLKRLGLIIRMVTGDSAATAKAVANKIGMGKKVCSADEFRTHPEKSLNCDVFAEMFPENKFKLVKLLQKKAHIVGMTGDGVNDAPALKQAQVGIAVKNSTHVARSSASIVLMEESLNGIEWAVTTSRKIFQRMLTYTLNKIVKSFNIIFFLSLGVIFTGQIIISTLLMVLLLFANDFLTMSIATDNVSFSEHPERWQISNLMLAGFTISVLILVYLFIIFFYALKVMRLSFPELQTVIFLLLIYTGQGTVYLMRERKHFWNSIPGKWLVVSSLFVIVVVSILATKGILMAPISPLLNIFLLVSSFVYLLIIDFAKVKILSYFGIQ